MSCKYYKDDFCVNADSPCIADYCPCSEYPELCKYYQGDDGATLPTYEELYEHWLKTKDKPKKKRKVGQPSEQLDFFDIIDNQRK